ncbi:uncharacterized protein LOC131637850 [Vicia villosa]|uniref:uncharacterized protein LOC131637850 n=1 Tax=Vicia villosa TaxID=3911 RepID=UPI00273C9164|nr:uncharacterized protein LOC131637850 [Vicia villosa]
MIQLDLQKAYDMLNWKALDTILHEIGIPTQFVKWIMNGVSTVTYRLLYQMQLNPNYKHHAKCKKLELTHLTFADDILLFSRGDIGSVSLMYQTVQVFSDSTGLVVNPLKCQVYMGAIEETTKQQIIQVNGFKEGKLPFRYLGVPLTCKKLSVAYYLPLVEKILSRLHHWSTRMLSYAGRVQLVKAVGFAIANYWMQCYPIPKSVLQNIQVACRTFIWTGGTAPSRKFPISWNTICKPMDKGGLNILNLEIWNTITMMKLLWGLNRKNDCLWVKWMHTYFLKGKELMSIEVTTNNSWISKGILSARHAIHSVQQTWDKTKDGSRFRM